MDTAALVAAVTLAMVSSGPRELAQEQGAASIHNPKPEMGEMGGFGPRTGVIDKSIHL